MASTNSNQNYTGLVQKYMGTAYDVVAEVQQNLDSIKVIAESINDGSFQEVADIADEIQGLIDKIDDFNSTYYGAYENAPVVDPNGDPITEGDLYYDLNKSLLMVFVGEFWIPLGAVEHTVERIIVADNHMKNGRVEVTLANPYLVGTHNLSIHRNGLLIYSTKTHVDDGQYTEISERLVYLNRPEYDPNDDDAVLKEGTEVGDELVFKVGSEAATITHIGTVGQYVQTINEAGHTVVSLPEGTSYIMGAHNLTVHKRSADQFDLRELQLLTVDYVESSPTSVTFNDVITQGSEITFTVGHIVSSDDEHFTIEMSTAAPNPEEYNEGKLWFKTDTGRMYILYYDEAPEDYVDGEGNTVKGQQKQWVSISNDDYIIPKTGYIPPAEDTQPIVHGTIFQDRAPDAAKFAEGTLWFNHDTGNLHIKYYDGNSHQWVKVSN